MPDRSSANPSRQRLVVFQVFARAREFLLDLFAQNHQFTTHVPFGSSSAAPLLDVCSSAHPHDHSYSYHCPITTYHHVRSATAYHPSSSTILSLPAGPPSSGRMLLLLPQVMRSTSGGSPRQEYATVSLWVNSPLFFWFLWLIVVSVGGMMVRDSPGRGGETPQVMAARLRRWTRPLLRLIKAVEAFSRRV